MRKQLYLPIKTEWFDKIISGVKKEEYRRMSKILTSRLHKKDGTRKHYDSLVLTAGYGNQHPQLEISLERIRYGSTGRTEWGAVEGEAYYVFELGSVITTRNLKPYQLGLHELSTSKDGMLAVSQSKDAMCHTEPVEVHASLTVKPDHKQ